jgi:hypothetical protein
MCRTDPDIATLKASAKRLEAKINALIERSPVLRSVKIEQLRARVSVFRSKT